MQVVRFVNLIYIYVQNKAFKPDILINAKCNCFLV
jgi:hypothetical protein